MIKTFEFASPEWLDAVREAVESHLNRSPLAGVNYVLGEEFTGVPARLNPAGKVVGWTIRIRDGVATTSPQAPPPDADQVNIADWSAVEHLAHHVFGADPQRDAAVAQEVAGLEASGKVRRIVRRAQPAELAEAWKPVHNLVVAMTGPRRQP